MASATGRRASGLALQRLKYLTEVSFLPEPTGGYWEDRGYEWYAGV